MNRIEIAQLIPHGDSMCMLDEVVDWNQEFIHCRSVNFASEKNPLFEKNALHPVLLLEYGAQAAAVHGALLNRELGKARPAYVGAVKAVEFLQSTLHNHTPIDINAQCLLNNTSGAIYEIQASQNETVVVRGRLILNQP